MFSPIVNVSDDGPTVGESTGAIGATVADVGAGDGGAIAEEVGSVVAVGGRLDEGAPVGGAERVTASGVVGVSAATVGIGVAGTGWTEAVGGVTGDVGPEDGNTFLGDGVDTGIIADVRGIGDMVVRDLDGFIITLHR